MATHIHSALSSPPSSARQKLRSRRVQPGPQDPLPQLPAAAAAPPQGGRAPGSLVTPSSVLQRLCSRPRSRGAWACLPPVSPAGGAGAHPREAARVTGTPVASLLVRWKFQGQEINVNVGVLNNVINQEASRRRRTVCLTAGAQSLSPCTWVFSRTAHASINFKTVGTTSVLWLEWNGIRNQ